MDKVQKAIISVCFNRPVSGAVLIAIVLGFSLCGRLHVAAEDRAQDNTGQSGDHSEGARHARYF